MIATLIYKLIYEDVKFYIYTIDFLNFFTWAFSFSYQTILTLKFQTHGHSPLCSELP